MVKLAVKCVVGGFIVGMASFGAYIIIGDFARDLKFLRAARIANERRIENAQRQAAPAPVQRPQPAPPQ